MKQSRTFKTIIILVSLLFINIEAAQAGLIHKFKAYIRTELTDFQVLYLLLGVLMFSFAAYVIFTPVLIGKEKWSFLSYYRYNPAANRYQNKRDTVQKIANILKNERSSEHAHY